MKTMTLKRPNEDFNKNCAYHLVMGQQVLTKLSNGEEKTIEIPDLDQHQTLKAKIKWCGSEEIQIKTIQDNATITIEGNKFLNRKMPLVGAMFPLIGLMVYGLDIVSKPVGVGLILCFIIAMLLTITVWRNKWLIIQKQ